MPSTSAERMKKMREKLKTAGGYEDYKQKHREVMKKCREKKKLELQKLTKHKRSELIEAERRNIRERVAKCRHLKKKRESYIKNTDSPAFKAKSSFGKAFARARNALPDSPRKKNCVVKKLFETYVYEDDASHEKKKTVPHAISNEVVSMVETFFQRDDISRQAPGIKDVKTIRKPDGSKEKLQTRHLYSSISEIHELFISEFGTIIGKSKFADLRPKHVLLSNKMPHDACLCKYHENFALALNALHKIVPVIPIYSSSFILSILCQPPKEDCWFQKCGSCKKKLNYQLLKSINKSDTSTSYCEWHIWKDVGGRLNKVLEEGVIDDLVKYILSITPRFFRTLLRKEGTVSILSAYHNEKDSASSSAYNPKSALMQVDFSENFTCIAQDEVQSFHWVQPQISLFTASMWHSQKQHPIVISSDFLAHNKSSVVAYLDRLFEELPDQVNQISIWSDGPTSQFKNRYIAASLHILEKKWNKKIKWNFFATSHGKGPVDGIGGAMKRLVRSAVLRRECNVFNSKQFSEVGNKTSKMKVINMPETEIKKRNNDMNLNDVFSNAPIITGILKVHCMQFVNGKLRTSFLSKYITSISKNAYSIIYGSDDTDVSDISDDCYEIENALSLKIPKEKIEDFSTVELEKLNQGTYVLVEYKTGKHSKPIYYAGICESSVDEEGDIKVTFLKEVGDKGLYVVNDKDSCFVNYEQIKNVLPNPTLEVKGNRIYYKFVVERNT